MFSEFKRESYRATKQAGAHADIVLVIGCGYFSALFECADRCGEILGKQCVEELGDGIDEMVPRVKIENADIFAALGKLTAKYSVSLVDVATGKHGTRFVLVWKIPAAKNQPPATTEIDESLF